MVTYREKVYYLSEFFYYPTGIFLLPYWNFSITLLEFFYYLTGIFLLPIPPKNLKNTAFFDPRNQVE